MLAPRDATAADDDRRTRSRGALPFPVVIRRCHSLATNRLRDPIGADKRAFEKQSRDQGGPHALFHASLDGGG